MTMGHSVLSEPGTGGIRCEDTYPLKEDGQERLTGHDWDAELPA